VLVYQNQMNLNLKVVVATVAVQLQDLLRDED
jgi:hypothetical protein